MSSSLLTSDLCERVKTLQEDFDTVELAPGIKQIVALLINQLSGICCSGKKLTVLYEFKLKTYFYEVCLYNRIMQ